MKVLVADDSVMMRKIILRSLSSLGLTNCVEAKDGQEAINLFQSETFDLFLTDWNMPKKSGLELVTEIRATGANLPIIMITTEAQKIQVAQAMDAGVTDYLTKPFDNDGLRAKLSKYVA